MRTGHILSLTLTSLIILTGCQIKQGGDIATQALPASSIQGQHSHTYTYRLDNGLQVILWPNSNSHSRNEASLDLVIHSGSLHEKDNQLGYAHFVEHMLFNQSKDNGDNPVFDALHELNLNLSNHANAYTTFGHTRYYLDLPNASHKRVTKAIELLSLFAYQAAFDCQEVAKEMGVIREEWRLSEPEKQTYQYQRQQLDLANSRYLTRLPIGNLDSIESATPAALQDYYQQHYHPGNATLIITGDIDIDKVATSIADSFDNWPDANKGRAKVYAKPPMRPPSLDIFEDAKEPAYFVWIGNSYANPLATDEATEFANFKLELITDLLHERLKKLATQQSNSLR
ncbi:MAG: pitrilysin family protein, partial [Gammaproteobacteria bacterium]|nr:pitrilysin family protein [Gammaproteobacteria bacterium]